MPKSKARKGRKAYVPKGTGNWGIPDPARLFLMVGQGTLDPEEEEMAAKILFGEMTRSTWDEAALKEQFGDGWPPADWQALVVLAKQSAQRLTRSTDATPEDLHYTPRSATTVEHGTVWIEE